MEKINEWKGASDWNSAGAKAEYIESPQTKPVVDKKTAPDVSGLGEGEATPFSAQRGEMP